MIAKVALQERVAASECVTFPVHAMSFQKKLGNPKSARWRVRSSSRFLTSILTNVARWERNSSMEWDAFPNDDNLKFEPVIKL
jgi:hypothetical protein